MKVLEKFDTVYKWLLGYNEKLACEFYKQNRSEFETENDAANHIGKNLLNVRPIDVMKWIKKYQAVWKCASTSTAHIF